MGGKYHGKNEDMLMIEEVSIGPLPNRTEHPTEMFFRKAKFSLVRLLTFGLFQNRLLDPVGSRIKGER